MCVHISYECTHNTLKLLGLLQTADLSDLEEQRETFHYLSLYYSALADVEQGTVPCRALRWLTDCTGVIVLVYGG